MTRGKAQSFRRSASCRRAALACAARVAHATSVASSPQRASGLWMPLDIFKSEIEIKIESNQYNQFSKES